MRILIFLVYACFAYQSNERKLLNYQRITGISETKLDEIRRLAENHSTEKPKFRYSTNSALPAATSMHVNFEIEELNVNSVINGGVFICTYPGIYYFSATLDGQTDVIGVHIVHNGVLGAYGRGDNRSTASADTILELELFDTVSVVKTHGPGHRHSAANYFQGFMLE